MYNVPRKEIYAVRWKSGGGGGPGGGEGEAESKLELIGSMREHEFFDLKPDD